MLLVLGLHSDVLFLHTNRHTTFPYVALHALMIHSSDDLSAAACSSMICLSSFFFFGVVFFFGRFSAMTVRRRFCELLERCAHGDSGSEENSSLCPPLAESVALLAVPGLNEECSLDGVLG